MPLKLRNTLISVFVVVWLCLFHYESTRYFYLQPFFRKPFPKVKFLFPPAGWIMFFNVDDGYSYAKVVGFKNDTHQLIDPHRIFRTRFIGFDDIHRNVLGVALNPDVKPDFCRFLKRKFPEFDHFSIVGVDYPSLTQSPYERRAVVYECE